ncbi:dynein light chain roadblock-type 1-like [Centruroides vittatus]|uniref:dynein light chain roadblock-type 1-like n=1 Tax=Centruroides vittatus TaxID=120091 RepID=UPI00350F4268
MDADEILRNLRSRRGVKGLILANNCGIPIKTTLDIPYSASANYAELVVGMVEKSRSTIRQLDPINDLSFIRIRSEKNEVIAVPDKEYILIGIQDPTS